MSKQTPCPDCGQVHAVPDEAITAMFKAMFGDEVVVIHGTDPAPLKVDAANLFVSRGGVKVEDQAQGIKDFMDAAMKKEDPRSNPDHPTQWVKDFEARAEINAKDAIVKEAAANEDLQRWKERAQKAEYDLLTIRKLLSHQQDQLRSVVSAL